MRTNKKEKKGAFSFIMKLLLQVLAFVLVLVSNSALWMNKNFGGMKLQAAVFQLSTPMRGTGHELVYAYIKECLVKSVIEVAVAIVLVALIKAILQYEKITWEIKIFRVEKRISLPWKKSTLKTSALWMLVLILLTVWCYRSLVKIGVKEYIASLNNDNKYLEENFVDPRDVKIEFPETKRNLLFIYLESMESTYASVEDGGGKPLNYIPNLTKLANDNISFSNTDNKFGGYNWYSLCGWTMAAIMGSTSGAPYLIPVIEDGDYEELLPNLYTIGDVLKDAGYQNYFMCGSDARFGARKAYYQSHGNYTIYDYYSAVEDDIIPEDYYVFWGMEDKYLYQYAQDKLTEIGKKDEPFNFTMLSVDTHHMDGYLCSYCGDSHDSKYGNVISCADVQIQNFLEWVYEQDWYENTTVVVVGDHNSMNNNFWDDLPKDYRRSIYNCFINVPEESKTDNTTNRQLTSLDLFPTTLGALGVRIEGERLGLGTNAFSGVPTLQERDGIEEFNKQSQQYSGYFEKEYILKTTKRE